LPHQTKIVRKPEGVGAEFKSVACAQTGNILKLDLMEGQERNAVKEFNNLGAGTGTTMRLTRPWHGTNRVLVGDSWFASLLTAFELWRVGLFFMGIVKTASRFFPKKFLSTWCVENNSRENRGKHIILKTVKEGVNLYALGWSDKKGKQVITTTGTTLPADPSRRRRHKRVLVDGRWEKEVYFKNVPRPSIIKELFDAFSAIDVHDHLRQGSLEMEREWKTQSWVLRIFATVLGMITVNAFNAYIYMMEHNGPQLDFNKFLGKLSYELIFNKFLLEEERVLRMRGAGAAPDADEEEKHIHQPALLSQLPQYAYLEGSNTRARRRCKTCDHKTAWYCIQCSEGAADFVCYCSGNTERTCFVTHAVE